MRPSIRDISNFGIHLAWLMLVLPGCVIPGDQVFDPISMDVLQVDATHPPAFHELIMPSHGFLISGFALLANGQGPHPTVVLLHGYPGNEKNLDLAQSMRRAGFNILFFHYRGAWGSQGEYSLTHLSEDVASVLRYARSNAETLRIDNARLSVMGHSMGGFAALRSASTDIDLICVAGLAAANLGEYASRDAQQKNGLRTYTDKQFMLHGFGGEQALAEIERHAEEFDVRSYGSGLEGKSVLLIAGSEDPSVPPAVQGRIVAAFEKIPGVNLSAIIIPGDHAFSGSRIRLQREVINWFGEHCR